jgi:hypothetical protein
MPSTWASRQSRDKEGHIVNISLRNQIRRHLPNPEDWKIETSAVDGAAWEARATIAVRGGSQHSAERLLRDKIKRLFG